MFLQMYFFLSNIYAIILIKILFLSQEIPDFYRSYKHSSNTELKIIFF
jgi:hypothetical protein